MYSHQHEDYQGREVEWPIKMSLEYPPSAVSQLPPLFSPSSIIQHTFALPTTHSSSFLLTHCSGFAPSCSLALLFFSLLVHPASSISSSLDGEPQQESEGSQSWLPGAPRLDHDAKPTPYPRPLLSYRTCRATLVVSISSFLPVYLGPVTLLIVSQYPLTLVCFR